MSTAQELVNLATALNAALEVIDARVENPAAGDAPDDTESLAKLSLRLGVVADAIGEAGIAALATDVSAAITTLKAHVDQGAAELKQIDDLKKVLNVAGILLNGAGAIAAGVASGNVVGVVSAAGDFVTNLEKALQFSEGGAGAKSDG